MLWTLIKNFRKTSSTTVEADGESLAAGITSLNAGKLADARGHLQAALAATPEDRDAAYYLGLVEAHSGHFEVATKLLEAARDKRDDADVNNALGNVRRMRGQLDLAAASYRHALKHDDKHLAALTNLGLTLRDQGAHRDALLVLDAAITLSPDHIDALLNKALVLADYGQSVAAEKLIDRALEIDADFAQAHLQRAFMLLRRRDFKQGWREYAWRVRIPEVDHWQEYAHPLWQGEALSGKRLLVQAEQGLGDQIMFASCLPDVVAQAQHVVIECDPRLAKLFARSFPRAQVYRYRFPGQPDWSGEPAPHFRARCGDLPRMLRNQDSDFPQQANYLIADSSRVTAWRSRLAELGPGLKVGVSWRGGTPATGQATRSIPLEALLPVLSVSDTHFISLQYGAVGAEVAAFRAHHNVVMHEWAAADADMDDVAALISSLDLIISVCTTAAHLAGALGKNAFVMVPTIAEWRYLDRGSTVPWYSTLELFRQHNLNDWDGVISRVKHALLSKLSVP
jgi:tetratricopeptide (TPR) repeat protein